MRWQSPRPTAAQMSALYASSYFGGADQPEGPLSAYTAAPANTRRYASENQDYVAAQQARHLRDLATLMPSRGTLLEVGSGRGGFLERAAADGWIAVGIEPSQQGAEEARAAGLDVTHTSLENYGTEETYDVVYSSHVLEHFESPREAVLQMKARLRPGGYVYAEVPNQFEAWTALAANTARRAFRRTRPSSLYSVHHLSFFGPMQLQQLFHSAGMDAQVTSWSPSELTAGNRLRRAAGKPIGALDRTADRIRTQGPLLQVTARVSARSS